MTLDSNEYEAKDDKVVMSVDAGIATTIVRMLLHASEKYEFIQYLDEVLDEILNET